MSGFLNVLSNVFYPLVIDFLAGYSPNSANADYQKGYDNCQTESGNYFIDHQMDNNFDESRLRFLTEFLKSFYTFPPQQNEVENDEYRLHVELMIYVHIWESKPFLKKLYRLAQLDNLEPYCWNVTIPEMGRHEFIRKDIKEMLKQNNNPLSEIMGKGFHSSLRNAFAHSEYSFDMSNNNFKIVLRNYKGCSWELPNISFDDWSERFAYSALLSYHLLKISDQRRKMLIQEFGTDIFAISYPSIKRNKVKVRYRPDSNEFIFKRD